MNHGACPNELATAVYDRTMRIVKRKFGHNPKHSQCIRDAVGEAFLRWYKSPADKTAHAVNEHAHWLTGTAGSHLLDSDPCKRRTSRGVRMMAAFAPATTDMGTCAEEDRATVFFESILRRDRGAPDFAHAEDNFIEGLDAWLADPPPPPGTAAEALAILKELDWTDLAIAHAIGVSRPTVGTWRSGRLPSQAARAVLMSLAARREGPPNPGRRPPQTVKQR